MSFPITGQVAVTGAAQKLDPTGVSINCAAFAIKAPATNANTVYIGPAGVTTATGYPLTSGDEFEYQRQGLGIQPTLQLTPNDFYVVGTAGSDVIAFFASP